MAQKKAFPYLYGIACTKYAFVAAHLKLSGDSIEFVSFARNAHDWEVDVFASFLGCCIQPERDGKVKTSFDGSPPKEGCSM